MDLGLYSGCDFGCGVYLDLGSGVDLLDVESEVETVRLRRMEMSGRGIGNVGGGSGDVLGMKVL